MTAIVFCGPTLEPDEARAILPTAVCPGPAAGGDVFRASCRGPSVIVLIDGYFDHRLSVWHKEVLWALSQGQRVYGSSSMGALRAAELAPFGMIGVGKIFELFADGSLEDDDEVAVVHDEAVGGYRQRSDALVNIRATLTQARQAGALSADTERALIGWAKGCFYAERSYQALLHAAPSLGVAAREIAALHDYLQRHGPTDQKRLDAIAVLERVRAEATKPAPPVSARFRFAYTSAWHVFRQKALLPPATASATTLDERWVPDHHHASEGICAEWLQQAPPDVATRLWAEAMERALALVLADGAAIEQPALQAESESFRRVRNLVSQEQAVAWMRENDLDVESFSSLMHEEVLVGRHRELARRLAMLRLANALRASAEYASLKPAPP